MSTPVPSSRSRVVARTAKQALGGTAAKYDRYWDRDERTHVDILTCLDAPHAGVSSFSTIGVSDCQLRLEGRETGISVELVGACAARFEMFGNVLATAAFCIMNTGWFCAPGVVFPGVVRLHRATSPMQDLYFVPPFLWGDGAAHP